MTHRAAPPHDLPDEIIALAERGWRLHPVSSGGSGHGAGKIPILKGWPDRATSDLDQLAQWAAEYPGCWWGLATGRESGVGVLDIDDVPLFEAWCRERGIIIPSTVTAITAHDGRHLYFIAPAGALGNWSKRIPGCDFRAERGNIIVPGAGAPRSWAPTLGPDDVELAPLPDWVAAVCSAPGATADAEVVQPTDFPTAKINALCEADTRFRATWQRCRTDLKDDDSRYSLSLADQLVTAGLPDEGVVSAMQEWRRLHRAKAKPLSWYTGRLQKAKERLIEPRVEGAAGTTTPSRFALTDSGNAERFAAQHVGKIIYVPAWHKWQVWDGQRWREDDLGARHLLGKMTARSIMEDYQLAGTDEERKAVARWAFASESRSRLDAMLALAQSEPGIPVRAEELDRDPWVLNVINGTIDLRSGELRPARPEDRITKQAPVMYHPDAVSPLWERFLEEVVPRSDVRSFLQLAVGYSLTGEVGEQVFFFLFGPGANGKGVFLNTLFAALGDYAHQAPPEAFVASKHDRHPTELADFHGRRLITVSEIEAGARWAESRLKALTGGDPIPARKLFGDFFIISPTHKLWIAANCKPVVRGQDYAFWRRVRLIGFDVVIAEDRRDPRLAEKLRAELPGVLAWAVRGCLEWQRGGLRAPESVTLAVQTYKDDMDTIGTFLDETFIQLKSPSTAVVANSELRRKYEAWCAKNGEQPLTSTALSLRLQEHGIEPIRTNKMRGWKGLVPADTFHSVAPQGGGSDGFNPSFPISTEEIYLAKGRLGE